MELYYKVWWYCFVLFCINAKCTRVLSSKLYIFHLYQLKLPWLFSNKESTCTAGDTEHVGWIPGLEKSSAGGSGNQLQYSCMENPMNRVHGDRWATVHGVTVRYDWTHIHPLMKEDKRYYLKYHVWPTSSCYRGFLGGTLVVKNLPANAGDIRDMSLIPGSGRSPGRGHDSPLQYSWLENPMDRGAWRATVHRDTKSQTWLEWLHSSSRFILYIVVYFKLNRFNHNFAFCQENYIYIYYIIFILCNRSMSQVINCLLATTYLNYLKKPN